MSTFFDNMNETVNRFFGTRATPDPIAPDMDRNLLLLIFIRSPFSVMWMLQGKQSVARWKDPANASPVFRFQPVVQTSEYIYDSPVR